MSVFGREVRMYAREKVELFLLAIEGVSVRDVVDFAGVKRGAAAKRAARRLLR